MSTNPLEGKGAGASSRRDQELDDAAASAFSHCCDATRITSKMTNVFLCPFESNKSIPHASIRHHVLSRCGYPSRRTKPVIRTHGDEFLVGLGHFLKETGRVAGPRFASDGVL